MAAIRSNGRRPRFVRTLAAMLAVELDVHRHRLDAVALGRPVDVGPLLLGRERAVNRVDLGHEKHLLAVVDRLYIPHPRAGETRFCRAWPRMRVPPSGGLRPLECAGCRLIQTEGFPTADFAVGNFFVLSGQPLDRNQKQRTAVTTTNADVSVAAGLKRRAGCAASAVEARGSRCARASACETGL